MLIQCDMLDFDEKELQENIYLKKLTLHFRKNGAFGIMISLI